jgi:uncharacterized membrane protein
VVAALVIATLKGDQMATQPPTTKDTPFGLEPNIAAFLAYFFGVIGGIIILVGGGTNKFTKWAAAQSITFAITAVVVWIAYFIVNALGLMLLHLIWFPVGTLLYFVIVIAFAVAWFYTWISALQGKEVRLPIVADFTTKLFASQL